MRKAFAMFDTDRSGDIDRYELKQALRQLGMEADSAQTQGIIQKYDTTGRGKLDLAAFNKLVTELLAFQKTGNPKAKPDEKSTLSAPLRLVVFAAANDKGGGRRELVHLVVERMRTHRAHTMRTPRAHHARAGKPHHRAHHRRRQPVARRVAAVHPDGQDAGVRPRLAQR